MQRFQTRSVRRLFLLALGLFAWSAAASAQTAVNATQVVDQLENTFGVHAGERRNHIKGVCAAGEFVGTKQAATYSRSALFSGKPVPVVARFSIAGGDPNAPDTTPNARGMALEFRLPDDKLQHITMISTPMFGAAQPKTFFDNLVATKPDPSTGKPDPKKVKAFLDSHPDARAQSEFLTTHHPPVSFANSAYFGVHTFKYIDKNNKTTLVRWRFVPQDGEKRLTDAQLRSMPRDFLAQELIERIKKGPVRWDMVVTIGQPGDTETDPTVLWPEDRKEFKAGTLALSSAMPQKGGACEKINYDPLVMADGIAATSDPILTFRSPAYAVSFSRRLQGK
ncbi:catalase family peroxidase [Massilia agilis]|uniref:Catalase-related peroxidase n=1 Tax=Massilia agilis TaxID=1811226 RepID=A0ABT2DFV0_9BURK|nr:catalase family peroxidase [Massilia agilis]MCS0809286.1 catalase family peroxidase [Massilia agilis]